MDYDTPKKRLDAGVAFRRASGRKAEIGEKRIVRLVGVFVTCPNVRARRRNRRHPTVYILELQRLAAVVHRTDDTGALTLKADGDATRRQNRDEPPQSVERIRHPSARRDAMQSAVVLAKPHRPRRGNGFAVVAGGGKAVHRPAARRRRIGLGVERKAVFPVGLQPPLERMAPAIAQIPLARGPAAVCALEDEIDPGAFHPDVHRRVKDAPVDHPDGIAFRRTFGRRGSWRPGHA